MKLVEGSTVHVESQNGTVTVKIDGSTKVQVSKRGAVADLTPGSTVMVQGPAGADGTVTARSINQGAFGGRGGATGGG